MPYLLSQDKRLEIGWIYRVIPHDSGRVDLINELGGSCGAPDVHDCDLTQWHTVPLSEPEYHQLYTDYAIASDARLTAAHQLIDQLIAPMPDPPIPIRRSGPSTFGTALKAKRMRARPRPSVRDSRSLW